MGPSSPNIFGLYIDELEDWIKEFGDPRGILHLVHIAILLYVDDILLLLSTVAGLQKQLNALSMFRIARGLEVNLGKTKIMGFNTCSALGLEVFLSPRAGIIEQVAT